MFSKAELAFLKSPEKFDPDYSRVLRCRIKAKSAQLRETLLLLQNLGLSVTENCNSVTEICNINPNSNQADFMNLMVRSPRFEPGSSAWQGRCRLG